MSEYSLIDKCLHKVALAPSIVRKASFDLEASLARTDLDAATDARHVFITGLARSGTTILLQRLHATNRFAAQTYRDMPFVMAPGLWSKVSGTGQRKIAASERAHGDGILVDADSVEAFEEVFWLTFAGDRYVAKDRLCAHTIDEDVRDEFRQFVANVIASRGGGLRYLSKNNNNILRMAALTQAFPNAHIVIPFRHPEQHARSLHNQHVRFCQSQADDAFERQYMNWLGHYEFGLDHRPFQFGEGNDRSHDDPANPAYWLEVWIHTYSAVLASAPQNAIFWDYDAFCTGPQATLQQLAGRLSLDLVLSNDDLAAIRPPQPHNRDGNMPDDLTDQASKLHDELIKRAHADLQN